MGLIIFIFIYFLRFKGSFFRGSTRKFCRASNNLHFFFVIQKKFFEGVQKKIFGRGGNITASIKCLHYGMVLYRSLALQYGISWLWNDITGWSKETVDCNMYLSCLVGRYKTLERKKISFLAWRKKTWNCLKTKPG